MLKTCFSIAIQNNNFTRNVLKIKNAIHRQKISVKAMDLILFGPPKGKGTSSSWWSLTTFVEVFFNTNTFITMFILYGVNHFC